MIILFEKSKLITNW